MKRALGVLCLIVVLGGCAAPFIAATAYGLYEASRAKSAAEKPQEAPHE